MKKYIKVLALSAALAAGFGLASCGAQTVTTTATEAPTTTEVPTTTEAPTTTETPTTTEVVKKDDYNDITKTLKLTADYEGKTFVEGGIEEATLRSATDGDTASFTTKSGKSVTIRFFSIDTPESTGSVEKWGKNASKFTKAKLEGATEILLQASTTPASVDSYGSRYLAYVWYKDAENSEWMNLNLEIVENGYSQNKCLVNDAFGYYSYFSDAQDFAKKLPLHIWSDDEDPYYSTEAEEVTIKDIAESPESYYNAETQVGSKVRFTGYVTDTTVSSSGTYTYTVTSYQDGKEYSCSVYAGYTSTNIPGYVKIGGEYTFTGSMAKYYSNYQISGLTYVPLASGGDYLTRLSKEYFMTFNSSVYSDDVSLYQADALYKNGTVTEATVSGTTLTIKADAARWDDGTTETFTFTCTVSSGFDASALTGKTFSVTGLQYTKNSNEIDVLSYSNFKWK